MHPATIRGGGNRPGGLVLRPCGRRYGSGVLTTTRRTILWTALADVVCVVAFAMGGRSSHEEANTLVGVAETAWPFLVGLAVGWVLLLAAPRPGGARRNPVSVFPAGCLLALTSWGLGMALRLLTDQGASGAFPLVAAAFLALTLIGWRAVVALVSRRGPQRSSAPTP